jgi:hypothetical protein
MAYTDEEFQEDFGKANFPDAEGDTLVTEKPKESGYTEQEFFQDFYGPFIKSQGMEPILQAKAKADYEASLPKTWGQEFTHGFSRSKNQLQQTLFGVGAMVSDIAGTDTITELMAQAAEDQDKEIQQTPSNYTKTSDIDSFDGLMRYAFGGFGELGANAVESLATGAVGGLLGSSVGPEGTVAGGIAGLIGKKAARELIQEGVEKFVGKQASQTVKSELLEYARGRITRDELQGATASLLANQSRRISGRYGATGALGASAWTQETGSIYNDLGGNPDVTESDRKYASILGGFVAAAPNAFLEGYIARKFFKAKMDEAKSYVGRYIKNFGKETLKVMPSESLTEVYETFVEEAAKNWADPNKRDAIFEMTPDQKQSFIDAGAKGALGGIQGGGIAAFGDTKIRPHPDVKVRNRERNTMEKANDLTPLSMESEAGADNERLSGIGKERMQIEAELEKAELAPEQKAKHEARLKELDAMENEIFHRELEDQIEEAPETLVTENKPEAGATATEAAQPAQDIEKMSQREFAEWLSQPGNAKTLLGASQPTQAALYDLLTRKPGLRQTGAPVATNEEQKAAYAKMDALGVVHDRQGEGWNYTDIGDSKTKNPDGTRSKGYVTFNNLEDLTPEGLGTFLDELRAAGFNGAVKTLASMPFSEKGFRQKFDNIVYHGKSDADVALAEGIAQKVFGADKIAVSRGLDPAERSPSGERQSHTDKLARDVSEAIRGGKPLVTEKPQDQRPDWLVENQEKLSAAALKGNPALEEQIAELHAQRFTAKQIADQLKTDIDVVRAIRAAKGMPERTDAIVGPMGSGAGTAPPENPEFTKWVAEREKAKVAKATLVTETKKEEPAKEEKKAEVSVVNEPVVVLTPIQRALGHLRAFNAQQMPTGGLSLTVSEAPQADRDAKLAEVTNLVNEIAAKHKNPEEAAKFKAMVMSAFTPDVINFLAGEDIKVEKSKVPGSFGKFYAIERDGDIVLGIPLVSKTIQYGDVLQDIVSHEVIHAAHLVGIRDQWIAEGRPGTLDQYEVKVIKELGAAIRGSEKAIQFLAQRVYTDERGSMGDRDLGFEIVRMTIEAMRTGRISEMAEAMDAALSQEKEGPEVSSRLDKWIQDLRRIYDVLVKWISGKDSPPQLQVAIKETSRVLDKYGVLVNEKVQRETIPIPPKEVPTPPPKKASRKKAVPPEEQAKAPEAKPEPEAKREEPTPKPTPEPTSEPVVEPAPPVAPEDQMVEVRQPKTIPQPEWAKWEDAKKPTADNKMIKRDPEGSLWELEKVVKGGQIMVTPVDAKVVPLPVKKQSRAEERKAKRKKKPAEAQPPFVNRRIMGPVLVNEDKSEYRGKIGQIHKDLMMQSAAEDQDFTSATRMFYDEQGNLLTREQAYQIALEAGQLNEEGLAKQSQKNPQLQSEDLLVTESPEKTPAAAPGPRPNIRGKEAKILDRAVREANEVSNQGLSGIPIKSSERKRARGEIPMAGARPQQLYYYTRPHSKGVVEAQNIVNKVGDALQVAEILESDPIGKTLGVVNDQTAEFPHAGTKLLYENVIVQLGNIEERIKAQRGDEDMEAYIKNLKFKLYEVMVAMGTGGGSYNASTGQTDSFMTGNIARQQHVIGIMENGDKIVGKNSRAEFRAVADELNAEWSKNVALASQNPKIIAMIRRLEKMLDEKRIAKEHKKTLAKDLQALKYLANKSAARAADAFANDNQSAPYIDTAIGRVVGLMTSRARPKGAATEHQLVTRILTRMARSVGKEMGLIVESPTKKQPSMHEQMAAILRNDDIYADFASQLRNEYIKEYGGQDPLANPDFMDQADELYEKMMARMWEPGMVKALVNEKMQELELKFAEIVQGKYEKGMTALENIRDGIAEYMENHGVTDQVLIDQLAHDLDSQIEADIYRAREKFLGSAKGIKSFLREIQTSLTRVALTHNRNVDSLKHDFRAALVRAGYPDSDEIPMATTLALMMNRAVADLVAEERERIVKKWVAKVSQNNPKMAKLSQKDKLVNKVIELANSGSLREEDVYKALAESYHLPEYSEEAAQEIQDIGDMIGESQTERQKGELRQKLANLLTEKKGFTTGDSFISWMYYSMLSGIGTPLVNIGGNFTTLIGYAIIESLKHPNRILDMLGAMYRTAVGKGWAEFREAFFTGYALGKQGEKWSRMGNPAEIPDAYFTSSSKYDSIKAIEQAAARFAHKAIRGLRGQYVGRVLAATDMWFYKIAEEMAYVSRVGAEAAAITPQAWESALFLARQEMKILNKNPDNSADERRMHIVKAHSIAENLRLYDEDKKLVNERDVAWREAHSESVDATFSGEPKYFLGILAKHIDQFTREKPIGRLLIPFTRVAANVTNHMLEWTPFGFARYALLAMEEGGNPLRDKEGNLEYKKHNDIALRAFLGMGATMVLMAMAGKDADDEDPFFAIYGDGPRDFNQRRMMMEKGWKPNTVKLGGSYWSYIYTPMAMMLAIAGKHFDEYRDGRVQSPSISNMSMASSAVALIDAVKNQSFIASASDLMAAVDSPDPQAKVSKVFARREAGLSFQAYSRHRDFRRTGSRKCR